jgi:coenzyme F420-0:L-glutamate ligase / coenzyme F420-1:gamma-L-glutamate ligase
VELHPLRSGLIRPHDSLIQAIGQAATNSEQRLRNGDIIAVASKVVSISENRIIQLNTITAGKKALRLARRYSLTPQFAQVVVNEADEIYGGVTGALLTAKDGQATANAGVDRKNSVDDSVVLWPANARRSAIKIQSGLLKKTGKRMGIIVVDSRVTPLRLGTIGLSLASVGFSPVKDFRGKPDLNGRDVQLTFQALGDGLAASAHVLMGEARERVPFVLLRGAPVESDGRIPVSEKIHAEDCLYMSQMTAKSNDPT